MFPSRRFLLMAHALLIFVLTGCSVMTNASESVSTPSDGDNGNLGNRWPLKFKAHYFDVTTYSTYGCKVMYGGRARAEDAPNELKLSSDSLGDKYPNNMRAGWGPIRNFPSPAEVTWRSKDGTPLQAEVDIGEIFKDELIRHNLTRGEIPAATLAGDHAPGIILEVNNRTINVYMRIHMSTTELQEPGNKYSNFRNDLIKVYSRTY